MPQGKFASGTDVFGVRGLVRAFRRRLVAVKLERAVRCVGACR